MFDLSRDAIIFFVIFACYMLAIQGAVMSYARYASHRNLVRSRLQIGGGAIPRGKGAAAKARKGSATQQSLTSALVRAGLGPNSQFVPLCAAGGGLAVLLPLVMIETPLWLAGVLGGLAAAGAPVIGLKIMRQRFLRQLEAQLPDAIDTLVRSLKAGHPVSAALRLVRALPAPVGDAFGTVSDEVTWGLDLETAMKNMQARVDQQDVGILVAALSLQARTGGNLADLLERLAQVIRERLRMRLKARALSAEGRFSALALSILPIALFAIMQIISPGFYGGLWSEWYVIPTLVGAVVWLVIGNVIMFRMVRFDI
ncbi:MAG: type II secretion system F family protein [Hyphomicrobiaceae bacterium]|nr:type II secretion system F family protein [Hyphomicrobiaceae bacterium]